jgi:hypothetical protein
MERRPCTLAAATLLPVILIREAAELLLKSGTCILTHMCTAIPVHAPLQFEFSRPSGLSAL